MILQESNNCIVYYLATNNAYIITAWLEIPRDKKFAIFADFVLTLKIFILKIGNSAFIVIVA